MKPEEQTDCLVTVHETRKPDFDAIRNIKTTKRVGEHTHSITESKFSYLDKKSIVGVRVIEEFEKNNLYRYFATSPSNNEEIQFFRIINIKIELDLTVIIVLENALTGIVHECTNVVFFRDLNNNAKTPKEAYEFIRIKKEEEEER